jgi:hypothetical protein
MFRRFVPFTIYILPALRKVRVFSGILSIRSRDCKLCLCCIALHSCDRHRQQPLESVQCRTSLPDSVPICEVCAFYNIYDDAIEIMSVYGQKTGFADEARSQEKFTLPLSQ